MAIDTKTNLPRIGMLATVRNRRAIIASVEPLNTTSDGRLHLVLEHLFIDEADSLFWNREGANHSWEVTMVNELLTISNCSKSVLNNTGNY